MTFFPLPSKKIGEGAPSPIFSESRATQFPCLFAYFSPQVRELSDFAVLSSSNNQLQSCFFLGDRSMVHICFSSFSREIQESADSFIFLAARGNVA